MFSSNLRSECCEREMLPGDRACPGCGVECRVTVPFTEPAPELVELAQRHADWKRRQALAVPTPRRMEPTLAHKMHRMNPAERSEVKRILNALTLRKTIRAVLREAQLLRAIAPRSSSNYDRAAALAFFNQQEAKS